MPPRPARPGRAADGKGLPAQFRMAGLLDGAEECVQIQVQDGLRHSQFLAKPRRKAVIFGIEELSGNRYTTHGA